MDRTTDCTTGKGTATRRAFAAVLVALSLCAAIFALPSAASAATRPSSPLGRPVSSSVSSHTADAPLATQPGNADGETRYGYAKVTAKAPYLALAAFGGDEVLHVDTEHEDADGFWYAIRGGTQRPGDRELTWVYQPYGLWCHGTATKIAWNPWLNTYWCDFDLSLADQASPGYSEKTSQCQQVSGLPWEVSDGYTGCIAYMLDWGTMSLGAEAASAFICAPWEDSSLNPDGSSRCVSKTYDWYDQPEVNSFWAPAPDTCTQMPADTNLGVTYRDPADFAPSSGDGTCTGDALAPNCTPDNDDRACTGVEPAPKVFATATQTITATGVATASGVATRSASYLALRAVEYRSAWANGRKYTGKGAASFRTRSTQTRSATVTVSDVERSATMTRTCAAGTMDEAQACAESMARADALEVAQAAADEQAQAQVKVAAKAQAGSLALQAARAAAESTRVTTAQKAATTSLAVQRAKADLARRMP